MSTELMHRNVVALTPSDVPGAQASLIDWCCEKIAALGSELREQRTNLRQAKAAKWKHTGWQAAVSRTNGRMIYYAKIMAALRAGYLIVPNFDVEVMAVRVNREKPLAKEEDVRTNGYGKTVPSTSLVTTKAELLPPGVGRYVDDRMFYKSASYTQPGKDGNTEKRHLFTVTNYDQPDFPVLAIKPVILKATDRAMSLRIFDRIGVVTGRKQDPVVIGEIIDPTLPSRRTLKRVSFFIAWWLDTRSL